MPLPEKETHCWSSSTRDNCTPRGAHPTEQANNPEQPQEGVGSQRKKGQRWSWSRSGHSPEPRIRVRLCRGEQEASATRWASTFQWQKRNEMKSMEWTELQRRQSKGNEMGVNFKMKESEEEGLGLLLIFLQRSQKKKSNPSQGQGTMSVPRWGEHRGPQLWHS